MENPIYTCLWFENNAKQAIEYYCALFPNSLILSETEQVLTFELNGSKFMALNGGPSYSVNPAISNFVYCAGETEIDRLYGALTSNGTILMPLERYDWSTKYAWLQDQFGVNWQLDVDDIKSSQKIVPTLLFANEKSKLVKAAVDHYTGIFPDAHILLESPYPFSKEIPELSLLFAQIKIKGTIMNLMSSSKKT